MVLHRRRRIRNRMLILLFALLLVVGVRLWFGRNDQTDVPAIRPMDGVPTDASVCSVTVSLTGVENESSLKLFLSVCEGMKIRPCVFVSTEWISEHRDLLEELSNVDLGLLLDGKWNNRTKKKTMTLLAEENERFLSLTGKFPRYVRLKQEGPDETLSAILQSYGQICVGSRGTLSDEPSAGCIVDCGLLNGTTGYLLAKFCGKAIGASYQVLPLSELQKMA